VSVHGFLRFGSEFVEQQHVFVFEDEQVLFSREVVPQSVFASPSGVVSDVLDADGAEFQIRLLHGDVHEKEAEWDEVLSWRFDVADDNSDAALGFDERCPSLKNCSPCVEECFQVWTCREAARVVRELDDVVIGWMEEEQATFTAPCSELVSCRFDNGRIGAVALNDEELVLLVWVSVC